MRVEIDGVRDFERLDGKNCKLIRLAWEDEERGFGLIDIFQVEDEDILIDSEYMSREFVKKVLTSLVDQARLACEEQ